jgi:putative tricarboxylic transport membrane protein
VVSAVVMMAATGPIASFAVSAFGPPEIFALIAFGLAVSASIGAETLWKGWLSVFLGLLIATIGTDPVGGVPRFNEGELLGWEYQSYYLSAGIHFIPMILGFFAVSEVLAQAISIARGTRERPKAAIDFPSIAEFWRVRFTMVRSVVIGIFSGILPGIGATLAAFLGYSQAQRWSRRSANFGKGELEGVVASETANNSATGAAMIPLLALGLPGGALTAMIMGIFQIHGMEPGPLIFINSGDLVWTAFAAMFWANVAIIGLGWLQTKTVVHILRVPFRWLAPGILILTVIGAYALRNLMIDVWVMFLAGVAGYLLKTTGYSAAGIVLGLILGELGESAFAKSMQLMDYDPAGFLERPIAAVLLVLAVGAVVSSVIGEIRGRRPQPAPS